MIENLESLIKEGFTASEIACAEQLAVDYVESEINQIQRKESNTKEKIVENNEQTLRSVSDSHESRLLAVENMSWHEIESNPKLLELFFNLDPTTKIIKKIDRKTGELTTEVNAYTAIEWGGHRYNTQYKRVYRLLTGKEDGLDYKRRSYYKPKKTIVVDEDEVYADSITALCSQVTECCFPINLRTALICAIREASRLRKEIQVDAKNRIVGWFESGAWFCTKYGYDGDVDRNLRGWTGSFEDAVSHLAHLGD